MIEGREAMVVETGPWSISSVHLNIFECESGLFYYVRCYCCCLILKCWIITGEMNELDFSFSFSWKKQGNIWNAFESSVDLERSPVTRLFQRYSTTTTSLLPVIGQNAETHFAETLFAELLPSSNDCYQQYYSGQLLKQS